MDSVFETLIRENDKKIVLLVMDGLGGLPLTPDGKTELETAATPNLDRLLTRSECGLHSPLGIGIAPGSAPGHLGLFGYDPFKYPIGRGVVAATGIGFPLKAGDVAVRLNFATADERGNISDRRAGRIPTEKCAELCKLLDGMKIEDIEVFVRPVKDYRACVIFRGPGLSDEVADTDTQKTDVPPLEPQPLSTKAAKTARIAREFVKQSLQRLKDKKPANAILLRGFAELPHIPSLTERFKLKPVALAVYPDYKGISRLVGMEVIEDLPDLASQLKALSQVWAQYNFFFIHHKYTDSKGEDGDFRAKVSEIEKVDSAIPAILDLKPDVLIVTGDHSTPALLKAHSCHPIPFLIAAPAVRPSGLCKFSERECLKGTWNMIRSQEIIRLALAYADKVQKYGA